MTRTYENTENTSSRPSQNELSIGHSPASWHGSFWSVLVTSTARLDVRRSVLVDVVGGAVALDYNTVEEAKARVICSAQE